jgi:hypothetical protein
MRMFLAGTLTVLGLLFGGVGVANATTAAPIASSTTTTLADNNNQSSDNDSDKTGLWGLAGLLGLAGLPGLLGLRRRNDAVRTGPGTAPGGTIPPQRG